MNGESRTQIEVTESEPGIITVRFAGELDIVSVEQLEGTLDDLLGRPVQRIEIDLTDLAFMDSSGLAVLVRITNRFGPVKVLGARPLIRRVIEVTGLTGALLMEAGPP